MNWYVDTLKKTFDFRGRARRREYWSFTLFNIFALMFINWFYGFIRPGTPDLQSDLYPSPAPIPDPMAIIFTALIMFILTIPVLVRRLHDTGRSGWWLFIEFVPFGSLILLVFTCSDSESGDNQYGPNPKGETVDDGK